MHFSGEKVHGYHQILKGDHETIMVRVDSDGCGHVYSCVCVSRKKGWGWHEGSGCVGSTLTKITGAHLLHEAVGTVLHLTLSADLGH